MPNINPNTRVSAEQTQANVEAYLALKKIPDYVPINPEHSVEAATLCYEELLAAEEALIHADNTAAAARDTVRRARWKLQNVIVGAKGEVKVRYGGLVGGSGKSTCQAPPGAGLVSAMGHCWLRWSGRLIFPSRPCGAALVYRG